MGNKYRGWQRILLIIIPYIFIVGIFQVIGGFEGSILSVIMMLVAIIGIETYYIQQKLTTAPYIIYSEIGFSTNPETFSKNIARVEKPPIFTSLKS